MWTDINSIVSSYLLQSGLSIHFYLRCLSFALDALKEIELDIIGRVHSEELTVDAYNEVKLPCNYVDYVRIGAKNGQYVVNLGITKSFNRKMNMEGGILQPYGDAQTSITSFDYPYVTDWFNSHGEFTGRIFSGNGTRVDEAMVNEERGVITLNQAFARPGDKVDLDFIAADNADADMKVHRYAEATITAYMDWKYKAHLPQKNLGETREAERNFYNQLRMLAARRNDLTPSVVKQIINRKFRQTIH